MIIIRQGSQISTIVNYDNLCVLNFTKFGHGQRAVLVSLSINVLCELTQFPVYDN